MSLVLCNSGLDIAHKKATCVSILSTANVLGKLFKTFSVAKYWCTCSDVIKCISQPTSDQPTMWLCTLICTKVNGLNYLIKILRFIHIEFICTSKLRFVSITFIRFYSANNLLLFNSIRISKLLMIFRRDCV